MPIGVWRGVGEQERLVAESTMMGVVFEQSGGEDGGMIAIAVVMRWAITQPTMCSRCD